MNYSSSNQDPNTQQNYDNLGYDPYADPEVVLSGKSSKEASFYPSESIPQEGPNNQEADQEHEDMVQEDLSSEEEQEEALEEVKNTPTLSKKEMHWKELRNSKKEVDRELQRARKEADMLRQRLEDQRNSYREEPRAQKQQQYQEEPHFNDDEFMEGRHAKYLLNNQQRLENQLHEQSERLATQQAMLQLRQEYNDFDAVVSEENVIKLRERYPAVAHSLSRNNDVWSKGASAYSIIKQYGIYQGEDDTVPHQVKAKISQNMQRPVPTQSVLKSTRPLQQTEAYGSGLTDHQKEALLREVFTSAKRW